MSQPTIYINQLPFLSTRLQCFFVHQKDLIASVSWQTVFILTEFFSLKKKKKLRTSNPGLQESNIIRIGLSRWYLSFQGSPLARFMPRRVPRNCNIQASFNLKGGRMFLPQLWFANSSSKEIYVFWMCGKHAH